MTHDYTRKRGVVHTEILLPPHAPPSFSDRATLWNSVELYEKAGNAQLAREIDAALPIELSREEQIRLVREYCSSQFVSRGMCVDFAIHDTDSGNPHCHIMLTMRPLDERGAWAAKSKKEYDLDENGERIRLPSGRYKTHKVDLTGWNDKGNALLWRKAWADISNAYLERAGSRSRIDHRSNAERGIDELPTVHMGVAACQMEKKGIATEKGELNRNIQKANRLIREIRAQIGKLKEWIADLFKARETATEQPPQSPNLANLLMKYLSVQREKSRKYSQRWQQQHTADELKTIAAAVNYLSEHGISNLNELDASLSSVSDRAYSIREGMKTAEERMKKLQKLIEYGKNYTEYAILKAVMLENGRGFALGEHPTAPSRYVTWACYDDKDGQRQYEWGHYGNDRTAMEQDFTDRVQDYQRIYNVGIRQTEAPGLYKYYSTQRPVDIGTFPKPPYNKPDEIFNYDQRIPVENGSFLAWGYLTYTRPLTEKQASDYELRPAPDNPDRPRPIAEQMKNAAKLAEADRGSEAPAPQRRQPDRGDR